MAADAPSHIFANEAMALRSAGFAVIPAHGKTPIRKGFPTWKHAAGPSTVAKWVDKEPSADIVYVAALSKCKRGGNGLIVIDGDDAEACEQIVETFGDTPGKVRTRRGKHFLYRDHGSSLGKLGSLKKHGSNADVKHGQKGAGIVVAPPSIHEKDATFAYAWDGCDATVIRDLPTFNIKALQDLIDSRSLPAAERGAGAVRVTLGREFQPGLRESQPGLREGSRGLGINDLLCRHAWAVDTRDDLLDVARTINGDYPVPLDDDEVIKRADAVWRDLNEGKLERWLGGGANARASKEEIKHLSSTGKNGGDALMLLMMFRTEHSARVRRGETFAINPKAMAECQSLDWSPDRFRAARSVLLAGGYIKVTEPGKNSRNGRTSTQYTLV